MQFLSRIDRIIQAGLKWTLIILMIAITLSVAWGVFTRFILQNAATWTGEFSGFSLVWITFLGSAYAVYQKTHIRFESLFDMLPKSIGLVIQTIFNLSMLAFFAIVMILGFNLSIGAMSAETVSLPITKGIAYLVLPIGSAIMVIGFFSDTVNSFKRGDSK
ncbi:TRAP transporter small permease [Desulfosporosinus lacus]|uniref:TRAP-type C4-dicarboxylate transport system, small permease component n=1 Tax=Desulfosporosinus lacus DSM 15449 TaxID=1121420 RepID=A0A1M6C723_9FIRM|nr:TRAP transporter small permease [Desulfosporosinus lacus]SHI56554.1 TRAP-type C4-dicarboxylate transport system, small permease component [Desulfosporosinus lacus DSM 15449]